MKLTKTCARFLRKNGGTLLAIGASMGVVLTAIETGKATIKAEKLMELNKDIPEYDTRQKVLDCWHFYIPAAVVGAGTIGCIVGANMLSRKEIARLSAAYMALGKTYQEYRRQVAERIESTELVYFFQTRQHRLSLEEVKMPVALMAGNFIGSVWNSKLTVTLGVRRKGSTVLLAAVVWKGMVNDYYGKTVTVGGAMKAALEPNTSYEFVLTGETEGFLVGNDSIRLLGTVTHDGEEKPNESSYVQLKAGSTELKEGTGIRTWFGGTMSFYAGDGAVLTPEKTVNIGTMDATLNRSGRTVVVQADEAVMVSVEYRPAFL